MKNTYLLDVIKAFKPEELELLRYFIESPTLGIGQKKEQLLLFQAILAAAPEYAASQLEKQKIFEQVFPDKPFVDGKLEKLMVELNKTLRNFAVQTRMMSEENQDRQQIEWLAWLRERGLDNRFHQAVGKYENELRSGTKESVHFHHALLDLRREEYLWENANNKLKDDLKIGQLIHQLDIYYLTHKTELVNQFLLQRKAAKISVGQQSLFQMESLPADAVASPLFEAAQQVNRLLRSEFASLDDFRQFMVFIQQNEDQIAENTINTFYAYLRSYCTLLIDEGHTELVPVLFDLYQSDLENGRLLDTGKIHPNTYLNIVQIAIRANAISWAIDFTEQYKAKIMGDQEQDFFYLFNHASCLFALGEFEKAMEALPFNHPSVFYQLMARRLELKAYFQMKSDLLSYKIDAFRKFVERTAPKAVAEHILTMNMNFALLLTQISQSALKDGKRAAQLASRISGKQWICERSWLLEKARELE